MNRRVFFGGIVLILAATIITLTVIGCTHLLCTPASSLPEEAESLCWVEDESGMIGYEITEQNTVRIEYFICFINYDSNDLRFSLAAKFRKKDTLGWLADGFLWGCDKDGELLHTYIKSGEKITVTYTFEGEYLGGTINENISFPEEIFWSVRI